MHRDEQISLRQVGDFGPLFEGKISVVLAGINHFRAQTVLDQFTQAAHDIQYDVLFHQTLASHGSQVPAAVAGIEH